MCQGAKPATVSENYRRLDGGAASRPWWLRLLHFLVAPTPAAPLPSQSAGHPFYSLALPAVICIGPVAAFALCQLLLPLLVPFADWMVWVVWHAEEPWQRWLRLLTVGVFLGQAAFRLAIQALRCRRLWLGLQPAPVPASGLQHAVVIPAYREPLEVLRMTLGSLAAQTCGADTLIVVVAMEAADSGADDTFATLQAEYGGQFKALWRAVHTLQPGEVAGKSSNENHAVRWLHKQLSLEHDPYAVMVTICDADSLFAPRFIEQLDWTYQQYPNPQRLVYDAPISTYRNFFDAPVLIRMHEVSRCQLHLRNMWEFTSAQSNYSLTLGLARDIDFWTPDNMPEDLHTTLKAFVQTNGSLTVVPVWSLIVNDLVPGWKDRYVQAKRHCWGVTEPLWALGTYRQVPFLLWAKVMAYVIETQMLYAWGNPYLLMLLFPGTYTFLWAVAEETRVLLIVLVLWMPMLNFVSNTLTELFLWRYVLVDNPAFPRPSYRQRAEHMLMMLVSPVLTDIAGIVFETIPRVHASVHAFWHKSFSYVTAPKSASVQSFQSSEGSDIECAGPIVASVTPDEKRIAYLEPLLGCNEAPEAHAVAAMVVNGVPADEVDGVDRIGRVDGVGRVEGVERQRCVECAQLADHAIHPRPLMPLPNTTATHRFFKAIPVYALILGPSSAAVLCQGLLATGASGLDPLVQMVVDPQEMWQRVTQVLFIWFIVIFVLARHATRVVQMYRLWLGLQPAPVPASGLQHAVVIPAYREPLEVLRMTLGSLASQTCGADTLIVVVAMEAADDGGEEMFATLEAEYGDQFKALWRAVHTLQPGEVAGKSSNENHAVRWLHKQLSLEHDPYAVMVTICDADSLFAPRFIEQLDWTYQQYPDGTRLVFDTPLSTYRNFFDGSALVRCFEIWRCHYQLSRVWAEFTSAQSNYSLTLGLARDIDFWTPDNLPEDLHTTLKAFVQTNGSLTVVPVWSLIVNDLVPGWKDRYVQAKRHCWGVTEPLWGLMLGTQLSFRVWSRLVSWLLLEQVWLPFATTCILLFPGTYAFYLDASCLSQRFLLIIASVLLLSEWSLLLYTEMFHWLVLFPSIPTFPHTSVGDRLKQGLTLLLMPVLSLPSLLLFDTFPRWHCVLHSLSSPFLEYVTSPKTRTYSDPKILL